MRVCTICGAKWRGDPSVCPFDGGALSVLADPLLGRTLEARYAITARIGEGGMGTVYRARDEVAGQDVAIKFLSPELALDANNRRRFLREAKAANRIDHEHVIRITDYGETDDGLVYLVMELLDGEPLAAVIERGPLAPGRAVAIATQIAAALARAHELEVVHRDIKPDNVHLLRGPLGGDFVKLLDFGLAKMRGAVRLTASGAVFGTPEYMAPEQARGAPLTGKADLYALGCILFEMVSGAPPFSGPMPDVVLKHIREPAPSLLSRSPGLPPELGAVVARLLEKDPARRHRDAHQVLDELRLVAERLPWPSERASAPRVEAPPTGAASGPASDPVAATDGEREPAGARRASAGLEIAPVTEATWPARAARIRALAAQAHPGGLPRALAERIEDLEREIEALDATRDALAEAERLEDEARQLGVRLGGALDVLGRDEARVARELEELQARREEARARLAAEEQPLRAAWDPLAIPPARLSREPVEGLRAIGRLASAWLEAHDALEALEEEIAQREHERADLAFQIAQIEGRLGARGAERGDEVTALRARALDDEVRGRVERLEACSGALMDELLASPEDRNDGP